MHEENKRSVSIATMALFTEQGVSPGLGNILLAVFGPETLGSFGTLCQKIIEIYEGTKEIEKLTIAKEILGRD